MDTRPNLHESLFSRNSTPPNPQQTQHPYSPQHISNNSSPSLIDSLFHNIAPPPQDNQSHNQPTVDSHPPESYDSSSMAPGAPLLLPDDPVNSQPANANATTAERQNALLSLLSNPSQATRPQPLPQAPQNQPQQVPTPPGSNSQRSNASPPQTDTQKIMDLMGGTTSRSTTYSDTQRSNPQAPSPPYTRDDFRSFQPHDHSAETSPRPRPVQQPQQPPPQQQQQQQQQQPPSPPRRSMFEFTSPFDHLSSSTGSIKKKAIPPQPSSISSGNEDSSWTSVTDPKRQSMENLLENLTRGQPQQSQPQPPAYESYLSGSDFSPAETAAIRAPLPPIPASKPVAISIPNVTGPPRGDSPKGQPLHRPQPRAAEVNNNQQAPFPGSGNRRDKESSPGPRGRGGAPRATQQGPKFTKPRSPSPQSQTIIFDVSQHLEEIQARDSVKSTAIALVRQDSIFLPGSTIGATHWVAYAMTRGRVRVISRSSGDRTLLQLPQAFSPASSVIDMAVYGNRLAGVTSDGGFVVWELPELITDDVPGRILLCVPPTSDSDAIRAVKWHPKDSDTLAIASDNQIYVIDLANTHALHGQPLPHSDLHHIGQPFNVPSTVVAFDFDVVHHALATISEDSSLTIWNMHDSLPYAVHRIRGEDIPSSLTFVDGGIVVGRRNGTIFQLLSMTNKTVLSTIKFVNSAQEDPDMFGHISYDTRIQTLWVANSRRESLIALKVHIEPSFATGEESVRGWIEQVAEFTGIKPTIHFVILTADADPHGEEALAACVAAKVPPGELALVAFSVHSSGVDQVLIRREWFDQALSNAESKLPAIDLPTPFIPSLDNKPQRAPLPIPPTMSQPSSVQFAPPRTRTPPSDDVDNEFGSGDQKGRAAKGKNVNWKEKEENNKDKASKSSDTSILDSSALGQALNRELKKSEDSLHTRIGRLINKEMDKQHQRIEEARLHEQAEDFARQEKILKLISTELTRNTTRVVEMAVKTEIQNSVLPALENITKTELKTALNDHVASSLADMVSRQMPAELEKTILRSSVSSHYAGLLSSTLTPAVERQIKEILTTNFFQFHSQQNAGMQQELMRELRSELSLIKSEFGKWHNESLRSQESTIRELEHTVRTLSEQVKYLSINAPPPILHHMQPPQQPQNSPGGPPPPQLQPNIGPSHLRQANLPPANPPSGYTQGHPAPFTQPPPQQQQQPPVQQWYSPIAAPQASHPATIPQPPPSAPQPDRTPPTKADQWDEIYLGVLHSQDQTKLRDLLSRTNPDLVLPLNGPALVSQAVILTLIHRLSAVVGDTAPTDETFKTSLWWLQRVASLLRPDDKLIADFIPRVIPTVQSSLNTTKQRLAILPGGSATMETARALSDVQEALRRKVAS